MRHPSISRRGRKVWYTLSRMGLFAKTNTNVLGVDIGARGVKMVELIKSGTRPRLATYGIGDVFDAAVHQRAGTAEEEARSVALYAQRLRKVYDACGARATIASASLPVSQVFSVVVRVAESDPESMRAAAQAQATKLLQYDPKDIVLDTRLMDERIADMTSDGAAAKKSKSREVLVIATLKSIVERYSKIFYQANIALESLETEAFGLIRSLVGTDPATTMIVDIGSKRTNFFMVERGVPRTQRSIEIGGLTFTTVIQDMLSLSQEDAEQVKKDMSHSTSPETQRVMRELLERTVQPIVKEMQYGFLLFSEQVQRENAKPERIILTGGSCGVAQLSEMLEDHFSIKTSIGDPWARVLTPSALKPVLDSFGPRMSVATGLALRLAL